MSFLKQCIDFLYNTPTASITAAMCRPFGITFPKEKVTLPNKNRSCIALSPDEASAINMSTLFHFYICYLLACFIPWMTALHMFIVHVIFELWESTIYGRAFFGRDLWNKLRVLANKIIGRDLWCDDYAGDSLINSICDIIAGVSGFLYACSDFSLLAWLTSVAKWYACTLPL